MGVYVLNELIPDTKYITAASEHTVWVSRRRTFIAEGTDTNLVTYVSTAFTTSMAEKIA